MSKKRYTLHLSHALARKFELVAQQRHGAKSALIEEALRATLDPQQHEGLEERLVRRLNEFSKAAARQASEQTVATETLALLVRYFLTVMPPIPESDQESARLMGRKRFEIFIAEVARRVAEGRRYTAEVLQAAPLEQPDLFATAVAARNPERPLNGRGLTTEEEGETHG
jgi:hypothetical protein